MSATRVTDKVLPLLHRIARWFVWGRRRLKDEIEAELRLVDDAHQQQRQQLDVLKGESGELQQRYGELEAAASVLREEKRIAEDAMAGLEVEYAALSERNTMVSQLLSAKPDDNPGLTHFRALLAQEYLPFANEESSLAEEAQALLLLQEVEEDLALLASFSGVYAKRMVAIGGGFSAGKSEFICSFFGDTPVSLAIGIKPVTALPAYVVASERSLIKGHAAGGGTVELEPAFYKRISHDFIKLLGFDLKKIMPFVSIGVPLPSDLFSHICLIDTPGYNPSSSGGYSSEDRAVAQQFVGRAQALVWVLGMDANGTLTESDLRFIRDADLDGRELYVVLNKADLRSDADIEDVLDEVAAVLQDEGIACQGLSAYSSVRKREYSFRQQSLLDFFRSQNQPLQARSRILARVDQVFAMYHNALQTDIERTLKVARTFKSMQLDVVQYGSEKLSSMLDARFNSLGPSFDVVQLQGFIEQAGKICERMRAAVNETFAHLGESADQVAGNEANNDEDERMSALGDLLSSMKRYSSRDDLLSTPGGTAERK